MTFLLPGSLDVLLGVFLEVEAAGFGEQVHFLYKASKRSPTEVEVSLPGSNVGSGLGPPLVGEFAAVVPVVTCDTAEGRKTPD